MLSMVLCGCGEDVPPTKSSSYVPPELQKDTSANFANQSQANTANKGNSAAQKKSTGKGTGFLEGASAVVDYGTGATPLSIKKRQEQKIQQIQDQHNSDINRAIREN